MSYVGRLKTNARTARMLLQNDVRLGSALFYPLRRQLHLDNQLILRGGIKISAPSSEPLLHLFKEIWVEGQYRIPGFSIGDGKVIVDVGSHVGMFTMWAAVPHPGARVIAVEPFSESLAYLRRNVSSNHLSNVQVIEAACGASDCMVDLLARGPAACNTIYSTDRYGNSFRTTQQVKMITLSTLFSDCAIEHCDMLKLDCEGAEYDILYSAGRRTLDRVENIAMEYHLGLNQHEPRHLAGFLQEEGFRVDLKPPLDQEGGYLIATRS
ncbi:FkbM family methyltransferase [Occallatibacter savannae]|uniref:FkbM family methyltransferase n=1 Tax=Occallatibacter savannae TaxID=1002691 RepID=UPI000D68B1AD|nr:FkbM family methyltransferase [Occallatibacter savannae]